MMAEQGTMTKDEISQSIAAGMGFVYDLYNELGGLLRYVQQGIESELNISRPLNGRLTVHRPGRGRSIASKWMQTALGLIVDVEAEADESEEEEEEEDDSLTPDDDEEVSSRARRKIAVTPETQLIAVRATLYDPKLSKNASFTPMLSGAVLTGVTRTPVIPRRRKKAARSAKPTGPSNDFEINAGGLSRLLSYVEPGLTEGQRIKCRVPRFEISASVSGNIERELAEFDAEEKLDIFVNSLIALVSSET